MKKSGNNKFTDKFSKITLICAVALAVITGIFALVFHFSQGFSPGYRLCFGVMLKCVIFSVMVIGYRLIYFRRVL